MAASLVYLLSDGSVAAVSTTDSTAGGTNMTKSSSATAPDGAGIGVYIHVVNDSTGDAVPGISVKAGPASSPDDLMFAPDGATIKECVHTVPSGSAVLLNGTILYANGTIITPPPCPLKLYTTNATGWVSITNATGAYYMIIAGNVNMNSYAMVSLYRGQAVYVTIPWPTGNATVTREAGSSTPLLPVG